MVCIVVLLTLLLYVNAEHTPQEVKVTVIKNNSTGLYECNIIDNILTEGGSAFIHFYNVKPDVNCSSNNKTLEWTIEREVNIYRKYKIKEVKASMNGTWKCNILPNGHFCDVNVRIRAKESWVIKVNSKVIGANQSNGDVHESVAEYAFCENELALVDCGKSKPATITLKVQDEPSVNCIRHNTVQAEMFMKMKPKYDGKYIECYHNEYGEVSVVRIKLKLSPQIYDGKSQDDGPSRVCHNKTYNTVDLNTTLDICSFTSKLCNLQPSPEYELIGLEPSNVAFLYKNSTEDKEIHYEYTDNQTLNLSWKVVLVANILNEYTLYWKDTSISSLPINTEEASCEVTQVYPPIKLGPEDDDTVIRFAVTMDERTVDKYRIILRRVSLDTSSNNNPAEKKSDNNLMIYIVTGVLGCIIVIIIVGTIWISKLAMLRKPEPILRRDGEETCYSNVYEEIPPFPPQWDKFSCRESTNSAYVGADVEYSEIGAAAEQSRDE